MTMSDDPIVLDEHRGMAAQHATEIRRRLAEVEADQAALRARRTELEKFLIAAPASTWQEAAEKAQYLIGLLAATSVARDSRRQQLIAGVLHDFRRLSGQPAATTAENDSDAGAEAAP
jgi:hypothetical protein